MTDRRNHAMTDHTACCSCAEALAALKAAHRLACEAVAVANRDLRLLADRLDIAIAERDRATAWLATIAELPADEAARVIRKLSTAVGTRNGVRVLDALIGLGWRPGGGE